VEASQAFYAGVFGWSFSEYQPGFVRAELPGGGTCAIQGRRQLGEHPVHGGEVTFAVDDVEAFATDVAAHGGRVLMGPTPIPGVGVVAFAQDPDGNVVGAIRFAD
jgi:predicted enzyme related to lactoylglutathione lyase